MRAHTRQFCVVLIGGIMLAGGLAACGKTQNVQALIAEAGDYHRRGDNKAAIIQLKNALQNEPNDKDARLLLARIHIDVNDPQSAEKEVRKAIELGADADSTLGILAKALLMQGKAEKVLEETQAAAPTALRPDIAVLRGNAYLALGKAQEAKESFERARKENSDYPEALIGLGKHALLSKDIDAADRYSELAVAKNPDNADAWYFRGDLLRAQEKIEPALAAYAKALQLKPNHAAVLVAKATIETGSGKYDEARASLEAARKAGGSTLSALYTQALLEYRQGRYAAALEPLQHVLRAAPGHMQAQLLSGAVQYELGATQQAEQHLKIYLEKNPADVQARKLLAATLLRNGEPKRAFAVASAATKDTPQDAQLLALAGESLMQERDFTKAEEYLRKASAIAPENALIRTALGKSKLAQGDGSGALAELEKAAGMETKPGKASGELVLAYIRQKQYDKALTMLGSLEKQQPRNAGLQYLRGGIYLAKGDVGRARQSFEQAVSYDPVHFASVASLARLDMLDKKPDAARKRFESMLDSDKKNMQAMIALGNLAESQKKNDEATRWFERAHDEYPDAVGPAAQLAMHYLRLGQKQKALTLAQTLQVSNPSNVDALDLLAQVRFANDDRNGALDAYEQIAALNPSSAAAYMRMASIHLAMQKPSAAADMLKKALALQPDSSEAQVALAIVEQARGNHEQALSIARDLQKRYVQSAGGHALEADLLMAQKKPALAVKAYERAYALGKSGPLAFKLHGALRQAGREKEAEAHIAQWIKDHPDDLAAHAYVAGHYLKTGQNKQAIKHYETILQHAPQDALAMNNLAWAYQQDHDSRALSMAEKAYAADSANAAVLDTLGWILIERGEIARGVGMLQQAVSLAPDALEIRYHLARGLAKAGEKERARSELQRLLAPGKTFPQAEQARALLAEL